MPSSSEITVSVIIPAYNRIDPLLKTLASARASCAALGEPAEILLVDDGSQPPLVEVIAGLAQDPFVRVIRQANQGSIVARQTGFKEARGTYILFLDSDDLIAAAKLPRHVAELRKSGAVASYDDTGELRDGVHVTPKEKLGVCSGFTELMLRVQPPPHGCLYLHTFLKTALTPLIVPALRNLDAVGDVWLYYNVSTQDGPVVKIDEPLSLIGVHEEARYSHHWEKLGVAALKTAELFIQNCPKNPQTEKARRLVGEAAFKSWRRLPRGFSPEYSRRLLEIWRQAPTSSIDHLGTPSFQRLARMVGILSAGRLLRLRNATYESCRTIPDRELETILR